MRACGRDTQRASMPSMYIMYVDESGDTGRLPGATDLFCLSGIAVHESKWRDLISRLLAYRRVLKSVYGLPVRRELHASEFMQKKVSGLDKHERLALLRNTLDEIAKIDFISITNVCVVKGGKPMDYRIFDSAWGALFQRFENTMIHGNFPGNHKNEFGMVITDAVAGKSLIRMRECPARC